MIELIPVHSADGPVGARPGASTAPPPASGRAGATAAPVAERTADVVVEGVEELVRSVVEAVDDAVGEAACDLGADGSWGTFLGVDPDTRRVVGTCGYRGAPRECRVEIAFWTFPPFEGCGWATAMARALVERAFADPEIELVLAHTLPEKAPATSVLTAAGFTYTGPTARRRTCARRGASIRCR